jgi:23S rRNA (uracil1939-C5)-methyltransferase/tRNA (uracil-5-)-methyltransferase
VAVLTPSTERVQPRCPLFGTCGGCQYQHYSYPAQLEWKRRHVAELLERIGGIHAEVRPTCASPASITTVQKSPRTSRAPATLPRASASSRTTRAKSSTCRSAPSRPRPSTRPCPASASAYAPTPTP